MWGGRIVGGEFFVCRDEVCFKVGYREVGLGGGVISVYLFFVF